MNKNLFFTFISFILIAFLFASSAEAKRFGGGSSFGSKKSYSSPFNKKSSQKKSASQQKASATNQQKKQELSKRGGLMGMLGGLALGGLLGALLFGGAFENLNFFDFFLIGAVIFAIYWFMKRKAKTIIPQRQQAATSPPGDFSADESLSKPSETQFKLNSEPKDASFGEQKSTDKNNKGGSFAESFGMNYGQDNNSQQDNNGQQDGQQNPSSEEQVILPEWFDQEEFLSGARSAYGLLQEAWDTGDLDSIKELTTEQVYKEISDQFAQEGTQGITRIVQLKAELMDFNEIDDRSEVSVLFDALLDEDSGETKGRATQVRELWHFIRANDSTQPTWYLDGIQQLES